MPGQFLTTIERERLCRIPGDISKADLASFFTLTDSDLKVIPIKSAGYNRLGFALQIGALRYMGFCPDDLTTTHPSVVKYVASQLGIDPQEITRYGQREQTRTDHVKDVEAYLSFRRAEEADLQELADWLVKRALEHDKPTLLFQMASGRLHAAKIVRPGVTTLERMVITARQTAREETYQSLSFLITEERQRFLDNILIPNETDEQPWSKGRTALHWLRYAATSNTPNAIRTTKAQGKDHAKCRT